MAHTAGLIFDLMELVMFNAFVDGFRRDLFKAQGVSRAILHAETAESTAIFLVIPFSDIGSVVIDGDGSGRAGIDAGTASGTKIDIVKQSAAETRRIGYGIFRFTGTRTMTEIL
jgi:hypothetical protein